MRSVTCGSRWSVGLGATAVALMLAVGVAPPTSATTTSPATAAGRLSGVTTATLNAYDYCGAGGGRRLVRTYTGSFPSTLDTGPRKAAGGQVESNPFHFHFLAGSASAFGSLELDSAQAPLGSLQQYWSFSTSGSGAVRGTLVNNGVATSTAWNLLNGQHALIPCQETGAYPFPFSLVRGSTMSGTLTSTGARLTFRGATSGGEYEFEYTFLAG